MPEETKKLSFEVTVKNPESNEERPVKIETYIPSKGRGKDNPKLLPVNFSQWTLEDAVKTWGAGKVWKVLVKPKLQQILSNFTSEAMTKTETKDGKEVESVETDEAVITKDYSEMFGVLSQRGETVQALTRRLNEIEETELPDLLEKLFGDDSSIEPGSEAWLELKRVSLALKEERAELKKSLESKKRKSSSADDGDEKSPEKKQPVAA